MLHLSWPRRIRLTPAISIVRRDPGRRHQPDGAVVAISTGSLGYLGAGEDDRSRWLASFRALLDGLDAPLQVVTTFTCGTETAPVPDPRSPPREHDRRFAASLADRRSAQHRSVVVVSRESSVAGILAGLSRLGVAAARAAPPPLAVADSEETPTAYREGGRWHRTYWVDRLPGSDLEPGWPLRLVPQGVDVTVAWHADPLPQAWIVQYLQRQLVQMRAQRLLHEGTAAVDPHLAAALPTAEDLQRRITSSQEKAFHLAIYLTVTAPDQDALAAASARVEAAARACLCELQPCDFRMADGRLATQPLLCDRLGRRRVVDSSSLATLLPWLDADLRHENGLVLGTSRATGCPIVLDPFDSSRYANANIGIFGHSGAGKTYLMSSLLMGSLALGTQAFVIDPEHEYGKLVRSLGGVDVPLHLGSGHSLNVLELRPAQNAAGAPADEERWLGPAVADAVDLMAIICGGLNEPERALAEAATRSSYSEEPEPVIRDVVARLPAESRPARILTRWVQGSLGAMFSARTNVDLDADLVVFGMRELREELIAPVHFLLAEALWSRIKAGGRRRLLVVDELGLLFEDPTIRRFVVTLARRIRKYDGALVFATQNPGDLLSSEAGAVVATNPAIHFFGAQRPGEAQKLQRSFQLSDAQRTLLEGARRGEFLLAAGAERIPLKVEASPRQAAILAGRPPSPP